MMEAKKKTTKKAITKKKATKKKTTTKRPPAPKTGAEVDALRKVERLKRQDEKKIEEWKQEQKLRKNYEKERADLAPWIGWEEYLAARKNEARIKSVGIIGAILRGEKRSEIRKKWRISPGKLNALLNSEMVDNVLAYSLGHLYSFQTACIHAILWKLKEEHDGALALSLLDKMGLFKKADKLLQEAGGANGNEEENSNAEDIVGVMFTKGDSLQTRQAREALEKVVIESLKAGSGD